jgi:ADP-ribose pyrophosphatase YjhB (NUDIX family)
MAHPELSDPTRRPARLHVLVPDRFGQAYITQGNDGHWHLPNAWRNYGETPVAAAMRATQGHLGLALPAGRFAWLGEAPNGHPAGMDELVAVQPELTGPEAIQLGIDYAEFRNFALLGAATLERVLQTNANLLPLVDAALSATCER